MLSGGQLVIAGVAAGLANGVVSGPVEHIRIRGLCVACMTSIRLLTSSLGLQTQSNTNPIYKGPFNAMKQIVSQHGISGLFKGQAVTFLREATGYGVYFLAYEKLVQREITQKGIRRDQINPMNSILYGAAAGYAVSSMPSTQCMFVCTLS